MTVINSKGFLILTHHHNTPLQLYEASDLGTVRNGRRVNIIPWKEVKPKCFITL